MDISSKSNEKCILSSLFLSALYQSEKKLCGDLVNDDFCKEQEELRRTIEEWLCYASEMDQAVDDHVCLMVIVYFSFLNEQYTFASSFIEIYQLQ